MRQPRNQNLPSNVDRLFCIPPNGRLPAFNHTGSRRAAKLRPVLRACNKSGQTEKEKAKR